MAEQFKSITDARKELPTLADTVEGGSDRFVITNQGKPQAVLLGYDDFKGLLAAVELMNRPTELVRLRKGLADTHRMSFEQLRKTLEATSAEQSAPVEATPEPEPVGAAYGTAPAEGRSIEWIGSQIDTMNERFDQVLRRLDQVVPYVTEGDVIPTSGAEPAPGSGPPAWMTRRGRERIGVKMGEPVRGSQRAKARAERAAGLAAGRENKAEAGG